MTENTYVILIVEDDPTIARLTREHLQRWGYEAICVQDFARVLDEFSAIQPHLVLLDISLPRYNGFYWCAQIRAISQVPILFLTSHTEDADVIMAMNMGGDEYITKPFSMDVLTARVNAIMRRAYQYDGDAQSLAAGGATLNPADGTLHYEGRSIELTRNESRILRLLIEQRNAVVTRESLMRALWEDEHFIDENTLTVNVNRLRRKLAENGLTDFILTRKGEGYLVRG